MKKMQITYNSFSLAEAMVVLVIISILMAVSAPLIARKAAADQNKAIVVGNGGNLFTAQGNNQQLTIGTDQGRNNPRLRIFGHTLMNGNLTVEGQTLINATIGGKDTTSTNNETIAFRVAPSDNGAEIINEAGFIVYGDGTTNVGGCMPDYEHEQQIARLNRDFEATEDGYVLASRCIQTYVGAEEVGFDAKLCPALQLTALETEVETDVEVEVERDIPVTVDKGTGKGATTAVAEGIGTGNGTGTMASSIHTFNGYVVMPVVKDQIVSFTGTVTGPRQTHKILDNNNYATFIPCK